MIDDQIWSKQASRAKGERRSGAKQGVGGEETAGQIWWRRRIGNVTTRPRLFVDEETLPLSSSLFKFICITSRPKRQIYPLRLVLAMGGLYLGLALPQMISGVCLHGVTTLQWGPTIPQRVAAGAPPIL